MVDARSRDGDILVTGGDPRPFEGTVDTIGHECELDITIFRHWFGRLVGEDVGWKTPGRGEPPVQPLAAVTHRIGWHVVGAGAETIERDRLYGDDHGHGRLLSHDPVADVRDIRRLDHSHWLEPSS